MRAFCIWIFCLFPALAAAEPPDMHKQLMRLAQDPTEAGFTRFWNNMIRWFDSHLDNWRLFAARLAGVLVIVLLAYIARWLLLRVLRRVEMRHGGEARIRSLLPMARNVANVVISVVALLTILPLVGINIVPLLAGAGVLGIAVGFGAQTLAKDVITGIFIVLEDAIAVGDVIQVGAVGGVVEDVSLRTVKIRDGDGQMHIIPFSTVDRVTNLSRELGYAALEVRVPADEHPDRIIALMAGIAGELRKSPDYAADILADPEIYGVDKITDGGLAIYAGRIKTLPLKQFAVRREFNRRAMVALGAQGLAAIPPAPRAPRAPAESLAAESVAPPPTRTAKPMLDPDFSPEAPK